VIFTLAGFHVTGFPDGETFVAAARGRSPLCAVVDLHLPNLSGLDILKTMRAPTYPAPIFIVSGNGDIAMAVEAIKRGATDYILKPFDARDIVSRVRGGIASRERQMARIESAETLPDFPGRNLLTPRERDVLSQIVSGASNKHAGRELGISPRTVEVHRARILDKLGARNAADLVRLVLCPAPLEKARAQRSA
jgi:FixJ family two-component response regulator